MPKVILHIDFDSYFASCEQQFNPKLRGKPIGVTAANGRTCIIAASREAKKMGVKSVIRVWEAKVICPQIITVSAHFEKYWEITQKFLDICKDFSPFVEIFSLDEVFMDITSTQNLFEGKYKLINKIRERIKNEIGEFITVSVGISYNKLLAKLASGINKPNGLLEITPQNLTEIYSKIKLTDLCGIGTRIERRLNKIGIYTPLELKVVPLEFLTREFKDIEGSFLKNLGLGKDDCEVFPYYLETKTKSIGRNYCLPNNEYDKRIVFQNVYELCEEISIKLRRLRKKAKTVWIYLGGSANTHARKTVSNFFDSGGEIFKICEVILKENNFNFTKEDYIRRISIGVSSFENAENTTLPLFNFDNKNHNLLQTIDRINDKFGDHTIRNAFLLYAPNLKTVPNGWGADRYERVKLTKSLI